MLFYSMVNSENKTCDWKMSLNQALKIIKCPFCTREMPYSAHWKQGIKKIGIKLLINIVLIS